MVRLISRQRGGLAALKLTKLFGIDDFPAAKDSGKVLIIIIYCYLIIIISKLNSTGVCLFVCLFVLDFFIISSGEISTFWSGSLFSSGCYIFRQIPMYPACY